MVHVTWSVLLMAIKPQNYVLALSFICDKTNKCVYAVVAELILQYGSAQHILGSFHVKAMESRVEPTMLHVTTQRLMIGKGITFLVSIFLLLFKYQYDWK